jgi:hypothetical protein
MDVVIVPTLGKDLLSCRTRMTWVDFLKYCDRNDVSIQFIEFTRINESIVPTSNQCSQEEKYKKSIL